ncbi:MAG: amino acid permease [Deltaproteobacteria bacterium]|nr:amino acid permease [Deltaproteobacteria bacterium]
MMEYDTLNVDPRDRLGRTLSLTDAIMLVVSSVIGSGIFLTPGVVADLLPDARLFLAAWIVGGVLSVAGALANAELGTLFPHAGGDYVYLREAYHPAAGFLVGWLTFFVIYVGSVATLAAAFAEGVAYFVPIDPSTKLTLAIAVTVVSSAVNYVGVRWGARFNNVTGFLKLAVVLVFACCAFFVVPAAAAAEAPHAGVIGPSAFGLALSPILFTYLGWNAPVYVASEMRRPARNLPIALFLGLGICTALYLVVNVAYLHALPMEKLRGETNVGQAAATALFGTRGGFWVALFVLISIAGSLNAMILVGPRIAYAMALDGLFLRGTERVHPRYRTPHRAILVQAVIAVGLILILRTYPSILDYTTFAIVLATMADTAALYTLRRTRPHALRPYRAWGYPYVPALYLVANGGIAVTMIYGRSTECALGTLMLVLGVPFYWILSTRRRSVGAPDQST